MHPQDMKPVPMYQRARFLETENERLLQEQEAIANALGLKQEPFRLADHVSALVEHLDMANEERTELQAENERLRRSILDYENDCAVLPEDYSVTEYVTHLRRELERPQFIDTYGCECGTCCTIRKFAAASE